MQPLDLINRLAPRLDYQTYLEIGVQHKAHTFDHVAIPHRECVDIQAEWEPTYLMPSDEFFAQHLGPGFYDCIYIDGDHRELPTLRDLSRAIDRLSPRGVVLCDNILPCADWQESLYKSGRAWRAWAYMRMSRSDLWMAALDVPFGLGVIRHGRQELFTPPERPYRDFQHDRPVDFFFYAEHRDALMNVISPEAFWLVATTWADAKEAADAPMH